MGPVPGDPTSALLDGRYELGDCVGQGGMAQVYRAQDALLGRTVAIKVMRADSDALGSPARARNEMRVLASLDHPSLVKLLDGNIVPGGPAYLVMEFVAGPTLAEEVARGPVPSGDVAHLASELASALHTVHEAGIVHRDVKPSNILLASNALPGRRFHAKLADFGVAYLLNSTHVTSPGTVVGTAAYLAPEQVRGEALTPAADVYALGLVLLEALSGERAYPHASGIGAVMARLLDAPSIPDHLGAGWTQLLSRMTATDAAARPTASEVAQSAFDIALAESAASALSAVPTPSRAAAPAVARVDTLPLLVPAAAAAVPVAAPAGSAATVAQALPLPADHVPTTRRASARRSKARWARAGMLIGSAAAAAALVVGAGLWAGATEGGTPELVADVPVAESPLPAEPIAEEQSAEIVSTDDTAPVAVIPATDVSEGAQAEDAKAAAEARKKAEKQAREAAKQAEDAAKQAEEAQKKAAEEERKRLEAAQNPAPGAADPGEKPGKDPKAGNDESGSPAGTR